MVRLPEIEDIFYDIKFILLNTNYSLNLQQFFKRTVNKDNLKNKDY